jgi:hypothetical protein
MFNNAYRMRPFFEEDGAGAGAAGGDPTGDNGAKNVTFKEMLESHPEFQAELDRRISQAVNTATTKERNRQSVIQDRMQDEMVRISKMTDEEKDKYFKDKADREARERERELTRRELMLDARDALAEKNLPADFVQLLDYSDKDKMTDSIEKLEAAFTKSVSAAVDERLKGKKPPKDARTEEDKPTTKEALRDEIFGYAKLKHKK